MELSAAVGFLRGIHFIKITARFRRGMAGRQRLINIARRHGVNNIGSLNLIIRKDSQHAACAAVIGGDDGITPRCWVINSAEKTLFSIARYAVPVSILLAGSNKKLRLGVPDFP
ncbi:hypothetical protein ACVXG9_18790 [Escherichia coli]